MITIIYEYKLLLYLNQYKFDLKLSAVVYVHQSIKQTRHKSLKVGYNSIFLRQCCFYKKEAEISMLQS